MEGQTTNETYWKRIRRHGELGDTMVQETSQKREKEPI